MNSKIYAAVIASAMLALTVILKLKGSIPVSIVQERLHQSPKQQPFYTRSPKNLITSLEKELDFLHPEIMKCEDIFKKGQNKTEFEHIWSELSQYDLVLKKVKSELKRNHTKGSCMEGYSYRYPEEGQTMAKLAR